MGVDVLVDVTGSSITVEVDLRCAMYGEEYPTLAEQREELGRLAAVANESAPSEEEAAQNAGSGTAGTAPQPGRTRRRKVSVLSAWRRLEVEVPTVRLTVPLDGTHVSEQDTVRAVLKDLIDRHYGRPEAARQFTTRTRQIPAEALESETEYRTALDLVEDREWHWQYPDIRIEAFAEDTGSGVLLNVSLTNRTQLEKREQQDRAVYDCRMNVRVVDGGRIVPQRFTLAPEDYRYEAERDVIGHCRGCVAVAADENSVQTTCLPQFSQPVVLPRRSHVPPPRWASLASDPAPILDGVESAMRDYLEQWDEFVSGTDQWNRLAAETERDEFADEIRRFRLGRKAMRTDPRLARAFQLANAVFAKLNANEPFDDWRLFQLVFIVSHLPALAAREHHDDAELQQELEFADVLWVATGGGKSEAYFGLIVAALFYDRLRGKDKGITTWLKFPLRMLSVQQLSRILRIMVVAEELRQEELAGAGEPFALGYLVGAENTPNRLQQVRSGHWWPGIEAAADLAPEQLQKRRLLSHCPFCHRETVKLEVRLEAVRLVHTCTACQRDLPLHMTDEEIYRYMPGVIVGTVDKLAGFAWFGNFAQFIHGPRYRCPDHGWFSFRWKEECIAEKLCTRPSSEHVNEATWYDPVPALIIQDELHLLREELGAFDAHYEGLLAELQRGGPCRLPSKILAASATIEQYEDQLRQIYGRRPRRFPSPGHDRFSSFYTSGTEDIQRLYVGVLPHYRRKADVAAIIQVALLTAVQGLQNDLSNAATALGIPPMDSDHLADLLFNYELSLAYVNNKTHGDQIADEITRLSDLQESRLQDPIDLRTLTGQVLLTDLAEAISKVERDTLSTPRAQRLRALVGTSVVSHGVDVERLNVMVMAGLPTTVADYIQASSRAGRVHVGLVVTVFDAFNRRERSTYTNFQSFHRFLDRMVEPVPVNKYAYFAADRTLPGVVLSLLWDMCWEGLHDAPETGVAYVRYLQPWWNAQSANVLPILKRRIESSYRSLVPDVNESTLEDELVRRVIERWENRELSRIRAFDVDRTTDLFLEKVLTSFRDIDEPVGFAAMPQSQNAYEALIGADVDLTPPDEP